jgi:hypothetical protein
VAEAIHHFPNSLNPVLSPSPKNETPAVPTSVAEAIHHFPNSLNPVLPNVLLINFLQNEITTQVNIIQL